LNLPKCSYTDDSGFTFFSEVFLKSCSSEPRILELVLRHFSNVNIPSRKFAADPAQVYWKTRSHECPENKFSVTFRFQ